LSHIPQRKEKDCLNCGTIVQGHYCHVCGQENVVPKETFWHMFTHFFYDITHFDSSFFTTVKDLLFRPGFLSKEYMLGRRAKYLHPVRLYVFTSAVFFLIFFSLASSTDIIKSDTGNAMPNKERIAYIDSTMKSIAGDSGKLLMMQRLMAFRDTNVIMNFADLAAIDENTNVISISNSSRTYQTSEEYDSIQKALPANKRDGWFRRRLIYKEIHLNNKYRGHANEIFSDIGHSLLHRIPYLLFLSLPLFALLLKLVYIRRKDFYYADHGVFTIHLYVFTFVALLVFFGIDKLRTSTGVGDLEWLQVLVVGVLFFYLYKAMRKFYGQKRFKTIMKFLIVFLVSAVMMMLLLLLFLFFSAFEL
jgi:hypothetical protein